MQSLAQSLAEKLTGIFLRQFFGSMDPSVVTANGTAVVQESVL